MHQNIERSIYRMERLFILSLTRSRRRPRIVCADTDRNASMYAQSIAIRVRVDFVFRLSASHPTRCSFDTHRDYYYEYDASIPSIWHTTAHTF